MSPNSRFKVNVYSFPKADANPIILILYPFGIILSRVICEMLQAPGGCDSLASSYVGSYYSVYSPGPSGSLALIHRIFEGLILTLSKITGVPGKYLISYLHGICCLMSSKHIEYGHANSENQDQEKHLGCMVRR